MITLTMMAKLAASPVAAEMAAATSRIAVLVHEQPHVKGAVPGYRELADVAITVACIEQIGVTRWRHVSSSEFPNFSAGP